MEIPHDSSWCWRRILDHRELAKKRIGVILGDGNSVADFIVDGKWEFPVFMDDAANEVVLQPSKAEFNVIEEDQLIWKRIKTRYKLLKWGVIQDASCVFCNAEIETEDHIFHDCMVTSQIWKGIVLKLGFIRNLESRWDGEIKWALTNFSGDNPISMVHKLALNGFIYHAWRERNQRIFCSQFNSADQIGILVIQDVKYKMAASVHKVEDKAQNRWFMNRWKVDCIFKKTEYIECTWLGLEEDEIMINTDGSKREDSGGCGSILRDHDGDVLSAVSGGSLPLTVMDHELQGVEMGMQGVISLHKPKAHLAIDSKEVYHLFTRPGSKPPWRCLHIWRRIKKLKNTFSSLKVSHCYKETNRAADFLASLHPIVPWVEIRFDEFTTDFREILAADKLQKVILRKKSSSS
ncbi:uncharacterized protein LOC113295037 [Papaver somniferum]|uniref:uncharacterized protein LOC113295037 n=1 Tax=Papaver somniferum TaxID=3469 RepID=UPI000E6F8CE2|nr:uncharacterized protein LOC113295037 [Papaver somniferum]